MTEQRKKEQELKSLVENQLKEESFWEWLSRIALESKSALAALLKRKLFRKRVAFGVGLLLILILVKK